MTEPKKPSQRSGYDIHLMSAEELERKLHQEFKESKETSKSALWNLARLYSETQRHDEAFACIRKFASLAQNADEESSCYLAQGQLCEQVGDYASAIRYYRAGLALSREQAPSWYWMNNNLGYSLVQLGRFQDATIPLQVAIQVDPARANAYKNMGLATLGMNRRAEAARCFAAATRANPADERSLKHLEDLVTAHPEVLEEVPALRADLDAWRRRVSMKN